MRAKLDMGPNDPQVGKFMIHVMGEGHDEVFDSVEAAREAAKDEKRGQARLAVFVLQVVDIA